MIGGMFGMTMALGAAGITQTYLERIMGFGYLETQQKIQVHYLMWLATSIVFAAGVIAFIIWDFAKAGSPRATVSKARSGCRDACGDAVVYQGRPGSCRRGPAARCGLGRPAVLPVPPRRRGVGPGLCSSLYGRLGDPTDLRGRVLMFPRYSSENPAVARARLWRRSSY